MSENQLVQVTKLNSEVKTRLAPSSIHGVGVFALRDIAKGEKLYADNVPTRYNLSYGNFGKLFPEVSALLLEQWPQIVNGSMFFYPTTRFQAFLNHSDTPNYDAQNDVMFRDAKAGDEITENYRAISRYEKVFPFLAA